jgi:hypothetical protein
MDISFLKRRGYLGPLVLDSLMEKLRMKTF